MSERETKPRPAVFLDRDGTIIDDGGDLFHPAQVVFYSNTISSLKRLQEHFDLTFAQLERRFLSELQRQHLNPDLYDDVRLVVSFYETVRRYQQVLDPSAYFLTAWLPEGSEMRERDLVEDYLRRPSSQENIVLESLIMQSGEQLHKGDFGKAERLLSIINQALEKYEQVYQNLTLPQGS